jgi:hypothetical protein
MRVHMGQLAVVSPQGCNLRQSQGALHVFELCQGHGPGCHKLVGRHPCGGGGTGRGTGRNIPEPVLLGKAACGVFFRLEVRRRPVARKAPTAAKVCVPTRSIREVLIHPLLRR